MHQVWTCTAVGPAFWKSTADELLFYLLILSLFVLLFSKSVELIYTVYTHNKFSRQGHTYVRHKRKFRKKRGMKHTVITSTFIFQKCSDVLKGLNVHKNLQVFKNTFHLIPYLPFSSSSSENLPFCGPRRRSLISDATVPGDKRWWRYRGSYLRDHRSPQTDDNYHLMLEAIYHTEQRSKCSKYLYVRIQYPFTTLCGPKSVHLTLSLYKSNLFDQSKLCHCTWLDLMHVMLFVCCRKKRCYWKVQSNLANHQQPSYL